MYGLILTDKGWTDIKNYASVLNNIKDFVQDCV